MESLVDGALVLDHCIPTNKFTRLGNLEMGLQLVFQVEKAHDL